MNTEHLSGRRQHAAASAQRHNCHSPQRAMAVLAGLALLAGLDLTPASAQTPAKTKTTGSHITRSVEKSNDDVRLEQVEVMLGAVRSGADRDQDRASTLPDLPLLDGDAFLDDAALPRQPR